MKVSIRIEVKS